MAIGPAGSWYADQELVVELVEASWRLRGCGEHLLGWSTGGSPFPRGDGAILVSVDDMSDCPTPMDLYGVGRHETRSSSMVSSVGQVCASIDWRHGRNVDITKNKRHLTSRQNPQTHQP